MRIPGAWHATSEEKPLTYYFSKIVEGVVQQLDGGRVEIAAVDPVASMQAVGNAQLGEVASKVRQKLKDVVESL